MLKRTISLCTLSFLLFSGVVMAAAADLPAKNPVVLMETSMGNVKIQLDPQKAPISVKNFLDYVKSGFYGGTVFHRVIPGFMVQGGGFTADLQQKPTKAQIRNEAGNGLKNDRGTIAMARTMIVDSASAQFFINVADNAALNHRDDSMQGYGYAVFGKVTEGMNVVDKIVQVPTGYKMGMGDVPVAPVVIKSMKVLH
ncbi:MAG TPA: peptidylprolyl isomerase [Geobacteraceae bacterium]|nr:peptidylprolyl isomerase [Geobacteraceae bacterium]